MSDGAVPVQLKLVLIRLCPVSYKGLVAEALRQLVGEQNYKQDEVLPPGYYTGTTHKVLHTEYYILTAVI